MTIPRYVTSFPACFTEKMKCHLVKYIQYLNVSNHNSVLCTNTSKSYLVDPGADPGGGGARGPGPPPDPRF